ncbi:TetR/AcrR family transcriptional regulator [Oscillospiraceae bacterium MB08-C2-2]|nr:TetR/AcrR family transcriptional regulator [Oscillospiraceae bacterium MB08-C2-2]
MRIIKDADERKNEILDAAETLFSQKGFDGTSISNIIEKVGVARGTVYYHFKSKEDIMDSLIDRINMRLLTAANEIAADKSIPVFERLFKTLMAMNAPDNEELTGHMHKPQNALMHQKSHRAILENLTPIITGIIEDGIKEGLFDLPYPYETVEMVIAHVNTVFDNYMKTLPPEERLKRIRAFIFNLDRLFGAKPGSFSPVIQLFNLEN